MPFRSFERWDYACSVAAEADIVIAEKSQAERVELISNPDLDTTMPGAFRSKAISVMTSWYQTPSGRRQATGTLEITYRDLPAAVGFEPVLRLEDGREITSNRQISHRLFARAGGSGRFYLSPLNFVLEEPETYTGSVVLRADPNGAYEDPAIKTIWDGELEFPVSFVIASEPNSPH